MNPKRRSLFLFFLLPLALSSSSLEAKAQIIHDRTLGNESSIVNPINPQIDLIEGGARRGTNLFHSFREFSIKEGHAAYFANPDAVQSIFSRVTGNNPSLLFGTLGVLGNANLFFINPNGIIFGTNARLDISGSFVGSTANRITFPDGNRFSATNPEGVPLLTVDVPVPIGLEFEGNPLGSMINAGVLEPQQNLALVGGTVVNTGTLSTFGKPLSVVTISPDVQTVVQLDETGEYIGEAIQPLLNPSTTSLALTLGELVTLGGEKTGLTVDSQGVVKLIATDTPVEAGDIAIAGSLDRVSVQAKTANLSAANNLTLVNSLVGTEGDLTLLAKDTVALKDSVENPLVVVAGGELLVQGNEGVDIFALNHPDSGLISGQDLVLRSSSPVIGDAHFWSGGSFRSEKLDGNLGDLFSPNDPIIRSQGDVSFFGYQGASLHIIAGGSVNINTIFITRTDNKANTINPTSTPDLANVTLSDGTSLVIDGSKRATLDIRAGVDPNVISDDFITGEVFSFPVFDFNFLFFNLVIEPFDFPTSPSSADITIGEVVMLAADGIVLLTNQYKPNLLLSGGDITITGAGVFGIGGINVKRLAGRGSDVILDARGGIALTGSNIQTASDLGNGGNITLLANKNILLESGSSIAADGVLGGNITIKSGADVLVTQGPN